MNQTLKQTIEEIAFIHLKKAAPRLVQMLRAQLAQGYSSEQIIEFYVQQTNYPDWRLALIGCAADYLKRQQIIDPQSIQ